MSQHVSIVQHPVEPAASTVTEHCGANPGQGVMAIAIQGFRECSREGGSLDPFGQWVHANDEGCQAIQGAAEGAEQPVAMDIRKSASLQGIEWAPNGPGKTVSRGEEALVLGVVQVFEPVDAGSNKVRGNTAGADKEVVTDEDAMWCYFLTLRKPPADTVRRCGAKVLEYGLTQVMDMGCLDAQFFLKFVLLVSRIATLKRFGEEREMGVKHGVDGRYGSPERGPHGRRGRETIAWVASAGGSPIWLHGWRHSLADLRAVERSVKVL